MIASIELSFVRNEDKSLIVPRIALSKSDQYSGLYLAPEACEELVGDRFIPRDRGIIVLTEQFPEEMEGALAHEWRHHWQHCHGWIYDGVGWNNPVDYELSLLAYFTSSLSEADAVRFQESRQNPRRGCLEKWKSLLPRSLFR